MSHNANLGSYQSTQAAPLTWLHRREDLYHAGHRSTTAASMSLAGTELGERQATDATISAP